MAGVASRPLIISEPWANITIDVSLRAAIITGLANLAKGNMSASSTAPMRREHTFKYLNRCVCCKHTRSNA